MEALAALQELGFYRYERCLEELCRQADRMAAAAGEIKDAQRFEAFPSFITAEAPQRRHPLLFTLHVGAHTTRAAVRQVEGEDRQRWKMLFEASHLELQPADRRDQHFDYFAAQLAGRCTDSLAALGLRRKDLEACGLVWSNPLENAPVPGRGIQGSIAYHAAYHKGEWFLSGAKDGFAIGPPLIRAFARSGISVKRYIIGNDTPLTMKALTFADGGMVASAGINGTLVKRLARLERGAAETRIVCNAEMGERWTVPQELLCRADLIDDRSRAENIESLCATLYLPRLFTQYLITLAHQGCVQFAAMAARLAERGRDRWRAFEMQDLTALLYDKPAFAGRHAELLAGAAEPLPDLEDLARALIIRAAKLCAVVAYATVSQQLAEQDDAVVALDSSLARRTPLFLSVLRDTLLDIEPPRRSIELHLLEPLPVHGGEVSVPMVGAAHALDNLLDKTTD